MVHAGPPTLTRLHLRNYRGFEDHTVDFRRLTILVGRNNAGKSTIVEALRFVSIVTRRYKHLAFAPSPRWSSLPRKLRGVAPSLDGLEISWEGLFHRYEDPPAEVGAEFSDGQSITIQLGPRGQIHAVLIDAQGKPIVDKAGAARAEFARLATMPQVAPLRVAEQLLTEDYVLKAADSYLAPLHFRNQLHFMPDRWRAFRELVAATWPGISVEGSEGGGGLPGSELSLLLRERDFVAEVGTMGHGLQMWLQTIWFFARTSGDSLVVLDEPDVYMHPDLQRRLIRLLRGRFVQTIVATHSVEILAECEPEDILVIDRECSHSGFAESLPAVQRVLNGLGTMQNLQLTRLWRARRFLIVEGNDLDILAKLHFTLHPKSPDPSRNVPHLSIGGWGGWQQVVGSHLALTNAVNQDITTFCILDRDYRTEDELRKREDEAASVGVRLHVWGMKELENYLLVPAAIRRAIAARAANRVVLPTSAEIEGKLEECAEELRSAVTDRAAEHVFQLDKSRGLPGANQIARARVAESWKTQTGRFGIVPGKEMLRRVSEWAQAEFGVGLSVGRLASSLRQSEIAAEVASLLQYIEGERVPGDQTASGGPGGV